MDYAPARHAGNAGDVLKHVALVALLEAMPARSRAADLRRDARRRRALPARSAGEWGDGVLRVWTRQTDSSGDTRRSCGGVSLSAQRPQAVPARR